MAIDLCFRDQGFIFSCGMSGQETKIMSGRNAGIDVQPEIGFQLARLLSPAQKQKVYKCGAKMNPNPNPSPNPSPNPNHDRR